MTVTEDRELLAILTTAKTVASVGVSSSAEKPSYGIFSYLKAHGYRMIPVNPTTAQLQGEKTYADLASIPGKIDIVQIFRKAEDVPPIIAQAIKIGAIVVWMQEGIINEEGAKQAEAAGLRVVMDRCMMKTHQGLIGK